MDQIHAEQAGYGENRGMSGNEFKMIGTASTMASMHIQQLVAGRITHLREEIDLLVCPGRWASRCRSGCRSPFSSY